jgi:DNA polymerase-3 subunit delta
MAKKDERPNGLAMLKQQLKAREPQRLYIFHGEEVFLLKHYLGQLRKLLVDELTESFNSHRFNNENFNLQEFGDAVEGMPMMAENTFVQVDEVDFFKMPEAERIKMSEFLADIPEWCTVVFTYETVEWKPDKRLKKLWAAVEENATIVEFAKQDQRDLVAWIQRHFAAHKKRITPDLCVYLIDITGGTMTALSGEIEKICAFSGAEHIHRSDIDAVVEPVLDAVVFQMTDLLSQGSYAAALEKLQTLLKMQQEPLAILGAVGSHYRRISTARTLLDHGRNATELAKLYGISEYPAKKSMEAARRVRPEFCARVMELVLETDYAMKTSLDDPERLLEMLILQLAQEGRNG